MQLCLTGLSKIEHSVTSRIQGVTTLAPNTSKRLVKSHNLADEMDGKRRKKMTIRKRGQRYQVDVSVNGKRIRTSFDRKSDAEKYERLMKANPPKPRGKKSV